MEAGQQCETMCSREWWCRGWTCATQRRCRHAPWENLTARIALQPDAIGCRNPLPMPRSHPVSNRRINSTSQSSPSPVPRLYAARQTAPASSPIPATPTADHHLAPPMSLNPCPMSRSLLLLSRTPPRLRAARQAAPDFDVPQPAQLINHPAPYYARLPTWRHDLSCLPSRPVLQAPRCAASCT